MYGSSLLRLAIRSLRHTVTWEERDTKRELLSAREGEGERGRNRRQGPRQFAHTHTGRKNRERERVGDGDRRSDMRGGRHGATSLIPILSPP